MLDIPISPKELWDERKSEFVTVPGVTLRMEHSLVSVSKWEAQFRKPFLEKNEKTREESIEYMKFMTISPAVVDPRVYEYMNEAEQQKIKAYMEDSQTATWFSEDDEKKTGRKKTTTSELIYYWMISLNIPIEFQKWHLNRLLTLIRVCNVENQPEKKMSKTDIMRRNRALNAKRRAQFNSKG